MDPATLERNRSRIIVGVDDSPEILMLLKAILGHAGYTFMGVGNGQDCLALVQRMTPRLILLDLHMPHLDGYELCRRLRTFSHLKTVPIAFLTATKDAEAVRAGIQVGGNDFIIKPFDPERLLERVGHWVSRPMQG